MGLGAFPGTHLLSLGMPGMHGTAYANKAILECDYLLSLGARFDDRIAGDPKLFAKQAQRAHIDIDTTEFNKRVSIDYYLQGELKEVLQALLPYIETKDAKKAQQGTWLKKIQTYKQNYSLDNEYELSKEHIKPQVVLSELFKKTDGKAILSTDVGLHQMWAAQFYHFDKPNSWITSGGLGTMGYGLPAAIGAQFACPDRLVCCVTGDGSYQMCIQELATIRQYQLPVKILLFNNNFLGMVRQWQELFFEERFSESGWQFNPDFIKLAESYQIKAKKITKPEEIHSGVDFLIQDATEAALLEVVIEADEKVFPMIPSGKDQKDMLLYADLKRSQS